MLSAMSEAEAQLMAGRGRGPIVVEEEPADSLAHPLLTSQQTAETVDVHQD